MTKPSRIPGGTPTTTPGGTDWGSSPSPATDAGQVARVNAKYGEGGLQNQQNNINTSKDPNTKPGTATLDSGRGSAFNAAPSLGPVSSQTNDSRAATLANVGDQLPNPPTRVPDRVPQGTNFRSAPPKRKRKANAADIAQVGGQNTTFPDTKKPKAAAEGFAAAPPKQGKSPEGDELHYGDLEFIGRLDDNFSKFLAQISQLDRMEPNAQTLKMLYAVISDYYTNILFHNPKKIFSGKSVHDMPVSKQAEGVTAHFVMYYLRKHVGDTAKVMDTLGLSESDLQVVIRSAEFKRLTEKCQMLEKQFQKVLAKVSRTEQSFPSWNRIIALTKAD